MESTDSNYLEDFIIVWLDGTINHDDIVVSRRQSPLRAYIHCIRTFTNKNECYEFIRAIRDERIVLVVSGSLGESFVPQIDDFSQLTFIYIFCADKIKHEGWCQQYGKIRGIFDDLNQLMTQLRDDVGVLSNAMIPLGIFDPNERSTQDLNTEQAAFLWFQLLIEVLLRLPKTSSSKQDMLAECRVSYQENEAQLKKIAEFEATYDAKAATIWYTKDTFIYRLFNKAFRTRNVDIIFKYRYFLIDLYKQLSDLHLSQFGNNRGTIKVYRGQHMHIEEIKKLQRSQGHLISINTFFSTSERCSVASFFSGSGEQRLIGLESVIFEIDVDLSVHRRPFGRIQNASIFKDEYEILFSMGTVFRIESVESEIDTMWLAKLKLTDAVSVELNNLLDFCSREHIGEQPSILLLGLFLSKMGALDQAKRFYHRLLGELPEDHRDFGVLHNNLGEILRKQGYLESAEVHFRRALYIYAETVTIFHPYCVIVHSNFGSLYDSWGLSRQALEHYRCALLILRNHASFSSHQVLSTVYNGMAVTYKRQGDIKSASAFYAKAFDMENQFLPKNHPSLASSYFNQAALNTESGNHKLALEQLEKTRSILQSSLPGNHLELAVTLMNIGNLRWEQDQDAARPLVYYQKAEKILEQMDIAPGSEVRRDLYIGLAKFYSMSNARKLAIQMNDKLIDEYSAMMSCDQLEVARCLKNKSIELFHDGEKSRAFEVLTQAYEIVSKLPHSQTRKILYVEIADEFRETSHPIVARNHYKQLLTDELTFSANDIPFTARLHNNLGTIYEDIDDNEQALKHYQRTLELFMADSMTKHELSAIAHHNVAVASQNMGRMDETRSHLQSALTVLASSSNHHYTAEIHVLATLARSYEKTGEWSLARNYHQRALDMYLQHEPNDPAVQRVRNAVQNASIKIKESVSSD